MTDLEKAKSLLDGDVTCVLVKGDKTYSSTKKGIMPMMDFIEKGYDLKGFSVADKIVGKATAMLFCFAQVTCVYAQVISLSALTFLKENNIQVKFDELVKNISNRSGNGICPMEETVKDISDTKTAYQMLKRKISNMS